MGILMNNAGTIGPAVSAAPISTLWRPIALTSPLSRVSLPPWHRDLAPRIGAPLSTWRRCWRWPRRRLSRRLSRHEGLRAQLLSPSPSRPSSRPARRLCPGGAAGRHAHGYRTMPGRDVNTIPGVMEVDELVDAALVGFDRREPVTIPPLPTPRNGRHSRARGLAMLPNFRQSHAAARHPRGLTRLAREQILCLAAQVTLQCDGKPRRD